MWKSHTVAAQRSKVNSPLLPSKILYFVVWRQITEFYLPPSPFQPRVWKKRHWKSVCYILNGRLTGVFRAPLTSALQQLAGLWFCTCNMELNALSKSKRAAAPGLQEIHQASHTSTGWTPAAGGVWPCGLLLTVSVVTPPPCWHRSGGGKTLHPRFLRRNRVEEQSHCMSFPL